MDITSFRSLSELGMEDPGFINQWRMNSLDEISMLPLAAALGENLRHTHPHLYSNFNLKASMDGSHIGSGIDRPLKHLKTNGWNSSKTDHISNPLVAYSPNLLSFVSSNYTNQMGFVKPKEESEYLKSINNPSSDALTSQGSYDNQNSEKKTSQGTKRLNPSTRLSQTQDHIMAERKRREKLSQRFIALSAIVPGLKKMDKASVLGDGIKYMKQLPEKVKTLEEQTRKENMESVVFVKKCSSSQTVATLPQMGISPPVSHSMSHYKKLKQGFVTRMYLLEFTVRKGKEFLRKP